MCLYSTWKVGKGFCYYKRNYKYKRNVRVVVECSLKKCLAGLPLGTRRKRILIWKGIKDINILGRLVIL